MERKLTAILYADVVGYSRLTGADEKGTFESLKVRLGALIEAIEGHGGRIVNTAGDAVLAEFASVVTALECAVAAQRELAERDDDVPEIRKLRFRIGVNLGDVIVDGSEIYGNGVNVAARLETLADAGGICISGRVQEQVEDKLDVGFAYLGAQSVKNIKKPVNVYKVLLGAKDAGKVIGAPKAQRTGWGVATAVVLALVVAFGGWATWLHLTKPDITPASIEKMVFPLPDKPSMAVLPFDNLTGDPEQEYIVDGFTETIIGTLSRLPELIVIARNSSFTYKGKPTRVQEVARELGVRYVLEGSIQRSGDRIRITVQLIDATTGHHLWSERYDRDIADFFALQDEIAFKTAVALEVKLNDGEMARVISRTTDNWEAWTYYVQSLAEYRKLSKEGKARSRELAQKAVTIDPDFVGAWLMIGWTQLDDARFAWGDDREKALEQATETAERIAALSPDFPSLHNFRGSIHLSRKEYEQAIAEKRRAIELSPSNSNYYASLGRALYYMGEYDEAVGMMKQAERFDPRRPTWHLIILAASQIFIGEYDQAIAASREGLQRAESPFMTAYHHVVMAFAYAEQGLVDKARDQIEKARAVAPYWTIEFLRKRLEFKDAAPRDRFLNAMRLAGMPESKAKE